MRKLIGISLGFCINDILNGEVVENDVLFIIANSSCETEEDWAMLEKECLRCHWQDDIRGSVILDRFRKQGKIIQPRIWDQSFKVTLENGRWFINQHAQEIENEEIPSGSFGFAWMYGGGRSGWTDPTV